MVTLVCRLRDFGNRMQTVETFARIASRPVCRMNGSSGWHILITRPANRCAVIIRT
jgi:hypothetical protein